MSKNSRNKTENGAFTPIPNTTLDAGGGTVTPQCNTLVFVELNCSGSDENECVKAIAGLNVIVNGPLFEIGR